MADARRAGFRHTALLLLGMLVAPHAAALARARAPEAAGCCPTRSCCCTPKAAPVSCHEWDAAPAPTMRCHHPAPEASVPALPALVSHRFVSMISQTRSSAPPRAAAVPRLGFGRIESPPPRSLGNA